MKFSFILNPTLNIEHQAWNIKGNFHSIDIGVHVHVVTIAINSGMDELTICDTLYRIPYNKMSSFTHIHIYCSFLRSVLIKYPFILRID